MIRRRLARRQRIGAFAARADLLERQAVDARELAVAIPTTYALPRSQLIERAARVNLAAARGQLARGDQP